MIEDDFIIFGSFKQAFIVDTAVAFLSLLPTSVSAISVVGMHYNVTQESVFNNFFNFFPCLKCRNRDKKSNFNNPNNFFLSLKDFNLQRENKLEGNNFPDNIEDYIMEPA